MPAPPALPPNEAERLQALRRLNILDTSPEERFERIARITRRHFNMPIALIGFIDADRQWFKVCQGLDAQEAPRDVSFCGHAILEDRIMTVPDARMDPRFADHPLVIGEPSIRFYAGAPLAIHSGHRVGTLCVIDRVPRILDDDDLDMLRDLGNCVELQLEHSRLHSATASLSAQQARLSAVLNTVVDGIITIDRHGTIDTCNPAAERIFGYNSAEVIGQNVKILMPAPYRDEHDQYIKNYQSTRKGRIIGIGRAVTGRRKDGTEFPMELAVSEMVVEGKQMFTGVVRDITERQHADTMKREFVSVVSHELRTPLTSIKGSLGLIQSGAIGELPPRLQTMLNIAYNNSDRLVRLINDLLDIEKIEAGKMDFQYAPIDISALVDQAILANKELGAARGVRFVRNDHAPGAMIQGDFDRLMQVFANLLSNAAKFSPDGGVVTILLCDQGDYVKIGITDQGPGIPEEFRDKIFGKFAQADSSDTRARGGTGRGLSVSKAIVEEHGGTIGFITETGKGTEFTFTLPVDPGVLHPRTQPPASITHRRVLICEDEANLVRLLQFLLNRDGFVTDVAYSAAEAERKLNENQYDAMTLDLCLPDKNGIALLREIRANPDTKDLPVVVVSVTSRDDGKHLNGNGIGLVDWIQKPIQNEHLIGSLRRAVRPQRAGELSILHVEDDVDILAVVSAIVGDFARIEAATSLAAARTHLERGKFDLVILDMGLPDGPGEDLLSIIRTSMNRNTPVIVFSAREISAETARAVNKALIKSRTTNDDLLALIRSVMETSEPARSRVAD